jgi:AcrR family transcriptional regulator
MPYSPEHKRGSREKILESARRLFNKKGFSEVSIDEVMENAGLTRGGFYRHFRDKDELYADAVRRFLCTDAPKTWQNEPFVSGMARKPRGQRVVDAYFSQDHFDDRSRYHRTSCVAAMR